MSFRFHCPGCQQRLSVSTRKRGRDVKCPRCRRVVRVPDSDAPESAEDPTTAREVPLTFPDVTPQGELIYAEHAPVPPSEATATSQAVQIPRYVLYTQGFLLGAVALAFFIFGLIVGSRSRDDNRASDALSPATVSGTVLCEDEQSSVVPDAGSVVVLLPVSKRPDEKAASSGLRPDDPEPDEDHPALMMLRSLGGDYTRADRRGRYQLRAAVTGRYYLLVVSKHGLRDEDDSPGPNVLAQLGRYFLPASELIGRHSYQWTELVLRKDQQVNVNF